MHDDRVGRLARVLGPGQRTALDPILRVRQRVLIGELGQPQRLHADTETRAVHHHEHGLEALVRLTDHPPLGGIKVQHGRGVAVDTHLVFQGATFHAIAFTRVAVCIGNKLRHDEQ